MDVTAIVSNLGGAAVGALAALAGVLLSLRHTRKMVKEQALNEARLRREARLIEKGEELHGILTEFSINFGNAFLPLFMVMKSEITYNEYLDIHNNQSRLAKHDPHRMSVLVNVYFPSLKQKYAAMQAAREAVVRVTSEHRKSYDVDPSDGVKFVRPLSNSLAEFDKRVDELKEALASEILAAIS